MKLMERLKKDKKGFTLVEMIVVIVIIGILLAILVPGMFKYIQKAKDKQILVDARTAYLDIQMAAQEAYGANGITGSEVKTVFEKISNASGTETVTVNGDKNSASITVTIDIPANGTLTVNEIDADTGKVEAMTYISGKRMVTMTGGVWKEVESAPADGKTN